MDLRARFIYNPVRAPDAYGVSDVSNMIIVTHRHSVSLLHKLIASSPRLLCHAKILRYLRMPYPPPVPGSSKSLMVLCKPLTS